MTVKPDPYLVWKSRSPDRVGWVWVVADTYGRVYGLTDYKDAYEEEEREAQFCFRTKADAIAYLRWLKKARTEDALAIEDEYKRSWQLGLVHGLRAVKMEQPR